MEGAFRPGYSPSDQKWKSELKLMKRDTYEINCHCQGGTLTNVNELSACEFEKIFNQGTMDGPLGSNNF